MGTPKTGESSSEDVMEASPRPNTSQEELANVSEPESQETQSPEKIARSSSPIDENKMDEMADTLSAVTISGHNLEIGKPIPWPGGSGHRTHSF